MRASAAVVRGVSPSLARCELTYLEREPVLLALALAQHQAYADLLRSLGLELLELPADPELPDCCFVEDLAVVLDEAALLTMPGAASRRGERAALEPALRARRRLQRVELPATLEGGDVLRLGRTLFVGRSARTNAAGIEALRAFAEPLGYRVAPLELRGCLHLKSAASELDDTRVLANPAWIDPRALAPFEVVPVAPEEPGAANVLRVNATLIAHPGFPRTFERLATLAPDLRPLDVSEFLKTEAALTCKSLLLA